MVFLYNKLVYKKIYLRSKYLESGNAGKLLVSGSKYDSKKGGVVHLFSMRNQFIKKQYLQPYETLVLGIWNHQEAFGTLIEMLRISSKQPFYK